MRSEEEQRRVNAAFDRYERAQVEGDRRERLQARVELVRAMEQTGWRVPPEVQEQLHRDEQALRRLADRDREADLLGPHTRRPPGAR